MAKMCGAKGLIVGHFSARYQDATPLVEEARTVFPATEEAVEGQMYSVGLEVVEYSVHS